MIKQDDRLYKEIRCTKCRRLLGLEYIFRGRLAIKCPKCHEMTIIEYKTPIKNIERIESQMITTEPIMEKNSKRKGVTG